MSFKCLVVWVKKSCSTVLRTTELLAQLFHSKNSGAALNLVDGTVYDVGMIQDPYE